MEQAILPAAAFQAALTAAVFSLLLTGCASENAAVRFDRPATMLSVADPRADRQLTSGFYPLEGAGRWTGRTFSATLKPPPTAARKGAVLALRFGIPAGHIERLHSIAVSANVDGVALAPEEFTKPGEFEYAREVPASAFRGGSATVVFMLDKAMPPDQSEHRELGVIVNTVGFEAK